MEILATNHEANSHTCNLRIYFVKSFKISFPADATSFLNLALQAISGCLIYMVICFAQYYLFDSGMRDFVTRIRKQIFKR